MDPQLLEAVRALVVDLARERYHELEADGRIGRLTASELKRAILEYGRTILPLPDEALSLIEEYRHTGGESSSLDIPMWTLEEGRSDLTLSVTASKEDSGYRIEISDLHVL